MSSPRAKTLAKTKLPFGISSNHETAFREENCRHDVDQLREEFGFHTSGPSSHNSWNQRREHNSLPCPMTPQNAQTRLQEPETAGTSKLSQRRKREGSSQNPDGDSIRSQATSGNTSSKYTNVSQLECQSEPYGMSQSHGHCGGSENSFRTNYNHAQANSSSQSMPIPMIASAEVHQQAAFASMMAYHQTAMALGGMGYGGFSHMGGNSPMDSMGYGGGQYEGHDQGGQNQHSFGANNHGRNGQSGKGNSHNKWKNENGFGASREEEDGGMETEEARIECAKFLKIEDSEVPTWLEEHPASVVNLGKHGMAVQKVVTFIQAIENIEDLLKYSGLILTDGFSLARCGSGHTIVIALLEKSQALGLEKGGVYDTLCHEPFRLCKHKYGARTMLKMMAQAPREVMNTLVENFRGFYMATLLHSNGRPVVSELVLRPEHREIALEEAKGQWPRLATDKHASRMVQELVESRSNSIGPLLEELVSDHGVEELAFNVYGNYVLQEAIQTCDVSAAQRTLDKVTHNLGRFVCHRFASNVVEKLIQRFSGSDALDQLVDTLLIDDTEFLRVMKDQFGNYIIQKMLGAVSKSALENLLGVMKQHLCDLNRTAYGRHVIFALKEKGHMNPAQVDEILAESGYGKGGYNKGKGKGGKNQHQGKDNNYPHFQMQHGGNFQQMQDPNSHGNMGQPQMGYHYQDHPQMPMPFFPQNGSPYGAAPGMGVPEHGGYGWGGYQ